MSAHGQMIDRIFDAAETVIVDHVAGHSDHKQIAEALIEYDLGRNARIGAAKNDCERMLARFQFCASRCCLSGGHAQVFIAGGCHVRSFLARLVRMLLIAARMASIALFQSGRRFGRRHDRLVAMGRIGGAGKLLAAKHTSREDEESKICLCHNISSFVSFYLILYRD